MVPVLEGGKLDYSKKVILTYIKKINMVDRNSLPLEFLKAGVILIFEVELTMITPSASIMWV